MMSDEKLARLIVDTINSLPFLAGVEKRADVFALYAALIQTTAETMAENIGVDKTMEMLAAVIAELAPRSDKFRDAMKAAQQMKAAQKGQFDV